MEEAATSLGYTYLKEELKKALHTFATAVGDDVFVSLPHRLGKSLCYALLPFIFDAKRGLAEKKSILMIVSPLIAFI